MTLRAMGFSAVDGRCRFIPLSPVETFGDQLEMQWVYTDSVAAHMVDLGISGYFAVLNNPSDPMSVLIPTLEVKRTVTVSLHRGGPVPAAGWGGLDLNLVVESFHSVPFYGAGAGDFVRGSHLEPGRTAIVFGIEVSLLFIRFSNPKTRKINEDFRKILFH